ncbi:MAG: DNA translocase FtsK [Patescibacteria group bacterium]|nr:MAG: DNA translocase FtsK [Patescibacteria group bacterium]
MPKKKPAPKKSGRHRKPISVEIYRSLARTVLVLACYTCALLLLASFFAINTLIAELQQFFFGIFGWAMFIMPFIFLALGMYIQGIKIFFARFHVLSGVMLAVFGLLGLTAAIEPNIAGRFGARVYGEMLNLSSSLAANITFLLVFLISLAIIFGHSLEQFLNIVGAMIVKVLHGAFFFLKKVLRIFVKERSELQLAEAPTIKGMHDAVLAQEKGRRREQIEDEIETVNKKEMTKEKQNTAQHLKTQIAEQKPFPEIVWEYPPISLFTDSYRKSADRGDIKKNSQIIEKTLESFGVVAHVVEIDQGPAVTRYCLDLTRGTKISKITSLQYDLALALAAHTGEVRIEAPIPGKNLVGVEIPNKTLEVVPIRALLDAEVMKHTKSILGIPLGFDAASMPRIADVTKMPHLLVAGTTNSGKSVMLNAIITTLLFRSSPNEVKLILVDPKRVEMSGYNGLPHLMCPVIHDPKETLSALKWAIKEMGDRYQTFAEVGARNIASYNEMSGFSAMPYIVIIIDEFADLMMYAPNEVEEAVCRLAQMARAVGIHLIIATQRPSVDVITGLIKANIPARIAFNVSSMVDSRVILDGPGAEKLLGRGDMLYLAADSPKPVRIQAPFVRDDEIQNLISFIKALGVGPTYTDEVLTQPVQVGRGSNIVPAGDDGEGQDAMFEEAKRIVIDNNNASASFLQRKLKVGYARAARLIDQLESAGVVGPANGSKGREVLRGALFE